ncbi:transglycosylase family protein [Mycobacterium shimoidei]|uniref:Resuscitation-promoting factor core lysozyme-like domain-containing protein n=1 Tax=Mycobacterium shimoidei TaxID=29313 RepID=A0A1E3TKW4_MYCSH|nr:transglycosylase family protein [Mycobacterium shimoidei]MCV7259818.1 transglycosylase family protein [Mycobacterium shimoidei]ODR15115.1 hypothetical protein BHQ16_03640 [Mycobacterium shimoidei]ORW79282.1 hypothetical protein AWC26_17055 [Mycobacterium shimoidei]SRX94637.1 hypothetical protein [Kitasatospora setae KM-6054] [Mycobacterium shimoidei]
MKNIAAVITALSAVAAIPTIATAEPVNWDAIAQCESGGNWAADTGNGFYGGLQISAPTWRAHGGDGFAKFPDDASRLEQIQVGKRIMAAQGPDAWPKCSSRSNSTVSPVGSLTQMLTFLDSLT